MGDSLPVIAVVGHGAGQFTDEFIRWTKEVEEDINQMITGFPSTWMSNRPPEMLDDPRALVEVTFTKGDKDEMPGSEGASNWGPSRKYWPSSTKYPDIQRRQTRFVDIHIIFDEAPDYWKDEKKAKTTICHEMFHAVFFHPSLFWSLELMSPGVLGDHFFRGKNAIREHNKLWEDFPQYHMNETTMLASEGVPLGRSRAHLAYESVYRSDYSSSKSDICPVCIPGYNHGDHHWNRPMMTEGGAYPHKPNAPDTQRYNTKISRLMLAMAEDCGFTVDYSKADDHKLNLDGTNANWKSCNPCPAERLKLGTYTTDGVWYTETRCRLPNSNPPSYISTVNINLPKVTRTDTSTDCDFYITFTGWIVSPRDGEGMHWNNVLETFVHVISFEKGQAVTSISVERKSEPIRLPDDWGDKPLGELGDYAVQRRQMPCFSIEELLKQESEGVSDL